MSIIFALVLSFWNGMRARMKGHNRWVWGLITLIAYFIASGIGMAVLLFGVYKGDLYDMQAVVQFFNGSVLRSMTIFLIGFGGYLAVRAIIDRLPTVRPPGDQTDVM